MIKKENYCIFVDGLGQEHSALVTAVNQRGDSCLSCFSSSRAERRFAGGAPCTDQWHDSTVPSQPYVTLIYVDVHRVESDNTVKMYDAKHVSRFEAESNPALPTFHVNCWKYYGESHVSLPKDHPAFDHPFKQAERDQEGNLIPTGRPTFAAAVNDHHATMLASAAGAPSAADLDVVADEQKAKEATE